MMFDDAWWHLMMLDDAWWCLMMLDDAWWRLLTLDDPWWCLMMLKEIWWGLMMLDDIWWRLMMLDDIWWCLMTPDCTWWHFILDAFKLVLRTSGPTMLTLELLHDWKLVKCINVIVNNIRLNIFGRYGFICPKLYIILLQNRKKNQRPGPWKIKSNQFFFPWKLKIRSL